MKLPITALLLSAAFLPFAGGAHAASLTSGKKLEIHVDEAKVEDEKKALWAQFGGWCAIAEWHPAIKSCEESKEGDAEYRTLTLQDGGKIKEKLLRQVGRQLPLRDHREPAAGEELRSPVHGDAR